MASLSAYIDFNIILQKDAASSSIILSDPDNYPAGVDITLLGYFIITQPDTITITGSFGFPDIEWDGSELTTATKALRLRATGGFQQGTYTIVYHVSAPGYDETVLTKTFDLSYTSPTLEVTDNFDVFIPNLSVTDDTEYEQDGMTLDSVTRSWEATIISVEGTNQDINGSLETFDLAYLGSYYDSQYDVSLTATATYTLDSPNDWVTIEDEQEIEETYYAFIPPTTIELLELLTAYKATVDAAKCICGTGCVDNCTTLKNTYSLAVSIYMHIVERGRESQTDGLDAYVLQLQKLLSNCVTPAYENTNEAISPYDWGSGGSGGTNFTFYKQMIVGSGVNGAPADGATTYVDALLISKNVVVFVDSVLMGNNLSDRVSITYNITTGTITWNTALSSNQLISIYTYE
jgi:hypothetical protein